jgi:hypothetical protein
MREEGCCSQLQRLEELVVLGFRPDLARLGDRVWLAHPPSPLLLILLQPQPRLLVRVPAAASNARGRRIQRVGRRAHGHHHLRFSPRRRSLGSEEEQWWHEEEVLASACVRACSEKEER